MAKKEKPENIVVNIHNIETKPETKLISKIIAWIFLVAIGLFGVWLIKILIQAIF
ncbi:MAG: hypothetical protein ACTSXD_05045 [Candidatus Heimdallarchaeaceae archaeon]